MPIQDDVGFSESTPAKIERFISIIKMHIAITQKVINRNSRFKRTYRYVDLTAGKGITPNGMQGCALTFIEQIESLTSSQPYKADFIERNTKNYSELETNLRTATKLKGWSPSNITLHHGDYSDVVPTLFTKPDLNELGIVFVDPSGSLPNFDTLHYIALNRPRMELLIYLASTNVKRQVQYTHEQLSDYISRIGKTYWLVGKLSIPNRHNWIFLLGTDTNLFQNYKRIHLYRLDSDAGAELFQKVNLTRSQHRAAIQPSLFSDESE